MQRERAAHPQTPPSPPSESEQAPTPLARPTQGPNPAFPTLKPSPPVLQSSRQSALFPEARTLSETVHSSSDGRSLLRVAILETSLKHPRVRLEERYTHDPDTGETILAHSVAYSAEHLILNLPEDEDPLEAAQALRANGISALVPWANSPVLLAPAQIGLESDALQSAAASLLPALDPAYTLEPDYLQFVSAFANDPLLLDETLWALRNAGQAGGRAGADISAIEAWDLRTDASEVVIGIVDTGARLDHEDLLPNLWTNPEETPGNGIDDDGNGIVDDIHGFDAVQNDGRPQDNNGHGTHVAGTAAASGNNGIGSTGVAWKAQVMVLRFMDEGRGFTSDAIAAIDYARLHGASVLNNSWGGGGFSNALSAAIQRAADADILFVAAAGNEDSDNNLQPSYPASYDIDSIISVASTDRRDRLSPFSNFGRNSVHLAAPGAAVRSTYFDSPQSYLTLSGTSMAAPHVAGAATLLRAEFPEESALQIKQRLLASVDPAPELIDTTLSGGRLNLFAALGGAAGPRPGVVSFERPGSVVAETAREAAVIVSRRAGSTGPVTVAYQTVSGSAEVGSDFEPASGLLRWEDGDASERKTPRPTPSDASTAPATASSKTRSRQAPPCRSIHSPAPPMEVRPSPEQSTAWVRSGQPSSTPPTGPRHSLATSSTRTPTAPFRRASPSNSSASPLAKPPAKPASPSFASPASPPPPGSKSQSKPSTLFPDRISPYPKTRSSISNPTRNAPNSPSRSSTTSSANPTSASCLPSRPLRTQSKKSASTSPPA